MTDVSGLMQPVVEVVAKVAVEVDVQKGPGEIEVEVEVHVKGNCRHAYVYV